MKYEEGIWLVNRAQSRHPLDARLSPLTFSERPDVLDRIQHISSRKGVNISIFADLAYCLPLEEFLTYTKKIPNTRMRQIILPAQIIPGRNRTATTKLGFCPICGLLRFLDGSEAAKHSAYFCFKTFSTALLLVDLRDKEYPSVRPLAVNKTTILKTLKFPNAPCFRQFENTLQKICLFSFESVCYISTNYFKCTVCERISRHDDFQSTAQSYSAQWAGRSREEQPFPNLSSLPSPTLIIMPEEQLEKLSPGHQDVLRTFWKNPDLAHTEVERLVDELKEGDEKSWLYTHFSQEVLHTASGPARALAIKYVGISKNLERPRRHFVHSLLDSTPHTRYVANEFGSSRVMFWSRVLLPRRAGTLGESALTDLLRPTLNNCVSPHGAEVNTRHNSFSNAPLALHWLQVNSLERQHFAIGLLSILTDLIRPEFCPKSVEIEGTQETVKLAGIECEFHINRHRRS